MKKLTNIQTLETLAKALNKPCMFVSFFDPDDEFHEVVKAAPYLTVIDDMQMFIDGGGILVFDSEEEMNIAFKQTVGDDGPTKLNAYNGKARVYALTCGADGRCQTENT